MARHAGAIPPEAPHGRPFPRLLAAACVCAPPGPAQVLVPPVGEPGDVIAIEGRGLAATQHVDGLAFVGGFMGFEHLVVAPLAVSDTRVEVQVPAAGHCLPPPPLADGDPVGLVTLLDGAFLPLGPHPADAQGVAVAPLPLPPAAAGLTVSLQWAFRHPQDHSCASPTRSSCGSEPQAGDRRARKSPARAGRIPHRRRRRARATRRPEPRRRWHAPCSPCRWRRKGRRRHEDVTMRARTLRRGRLQAVALLLGAAGLGGACGENEDAACRAAARPVAAGARADTGSTAALAGTWSGSARVGVAWCRQTLIPLSLVIAADGRVTGRVGDATLVGGRLAIHRGPLLRRLGLSSDWLVSADLAGPLVAAEGIVRSVVRLPFDVVDGRLHGSLVTEGTLFGGREALAFSAAFDELSRAAA